MTKTTHEICEDCESSFRVTDGKVPTHRCWAKEKMEKVCAGCCEDLDCDCSKVCDEGEFCAKHLQVEQDYWARYFGRNPHPAMGMSQQELTNTMQEVRKLK